MSDYLLPLFNLFADSFPTFDHVHLPPLIPVSVTHGQCL